jgi:flagella synthesis protein FlgN
MASTSPLTTLPDEHALISSLVELMKQEQQHLVVADIDGLNAVTPQKSHLVIQMAELAKQRHAALGQIGFPTQESGMRAWLDSSGDRDAATLWDQVLQLTREAKEINRVNGMLINKHLAYNQTVMQAMHTPTGSAGASIYGPNGQTTGLGNSRRFVLG